ncbi:hypothetical protein QE454_000933 [Microbacterium sp. SORGH_AS454]|nr:hypothetical protein [Microbacterium sp. SORGH_AS_0454]
MATTNATMVRGDRHAARPEAVGEALGELLHAARHLDEAAEDGAQRDDDEHLAHRRADAVRDQGEDVTGGDLRRDRHDDARDEQRDERVHLEQDDEHEQQGDARRGDGEQRTGAELHRRGDGRGVGREDGKHGGISFDLG